MLQDRIGRSLLFALISRPGTKDPCGNKHTKINARCVGVAVVAFGVSLSLLTSIVRAQELANVVSAEGDDEQILTIDRFIPHISTVPANAGQQVELFVRERIASGSDDEKDNGDEHQRRPVVLMITGSTQPAIAPFDLRFQNYSWMAFLAQAGFDVFAMDLTGYGLSPRPQMDNACNAASTEQAALLVPNPLPAPCPPSYPFKLTTSQSDWDEIDIVVDYLRELRQVKKVNLIGWSLGGPRAGGYAALHPDKVERLLLYAPVYDRLEPSYPPGKIPELGVPLTVRTITSFFKNWDTQVGCTNQFTPAVRDALGATILNFDPVGRSWGKPANTLWRAPVQNTRWGWNPASAALIEAPTLLIRGDLDTQVPVEQVKGLYEDLVRVPDHKVFVHVACAAHQLVWENQHMILLRASAEWLRDGTFAEKSTGSYFVDANGIVHPE